MHVSQDETQTREGAISRNRFASSIRAERQARVLPEPARRGAPRGTLKSPTSCRAARGFCPDIAGRNGYG
jgi:hypothetical protein